MIKLTRLDGKAFIVNAELIRFVEEKPDTFVTLTTGELLLVAESMDEVVSRTIRYQQSKHLVPAGWGREIAPKTPPLNTTTYQPRSLQS
jgi:flagellar protein FlbD